MAKKTIKVVDLKNQINKMLAQKTVSNQEKKQLCILLEGVLLETDNYKGFNNNFWLEKGCELWNSPNRATCANKIEYINGFDEKDGKGEYNRHYY